ncbi:hypothetical protein ACJJTC_009656 [Scirpophaga incertulas]
MEENVVESLPYMARNRRRAPDTWKRAIAKTERYSAKSPPGTPNCIHNATNKHFHCKRLTLLDIAHFHEVFYKTNNKKDQDAFILKHCKVTKAQEWDCENQRNMLQNYMCVKGTASNYYGFASKPLSAY